MRTGIFTKGMFLVGFALFIDGLQAGLSFVLVGFMGNIGGAAVGCLAGSQIAGKAGCWLGGILVGAVGTLGNVAAAPIGIMLAFVINICISLTMGSALIFALVCFGLYSQKYIWPAFIGEAMPGIDVIPGWTAMVLGCIWQKYKDEKKTKAGLLLQSATLLLAPEATLGRARAQVVQMKTQTMSLVQNTHRFQEQQSAPGPQRAPLQTKNFEGIKRPTANDNNPPYAIAA